MLISASGLSAALFAPFAGSIGDRFGRRLPLGIFCLVFAISGALPFAISDFATIFVSRVIVGFAYMGVFVIATALIGDLFEGEERGRWLGFQAMVATFSALVILPLSGLLTDLFDWRGPFLMFLAALPLGFAYLAKIGDVSPGAPATSRARWSALPWRWLLGVSALSLFAGVLFYEVQLQIGLAMFAVNVTDPTRIALLSSIAMIGIPVGALLFIRLSTMPFGTLMRGELLACGATLMIMALMADYRFFLGAMFVNMMASGMLIPTLVAHLTHHLEPEVRARGIGVWQCAFSLGSFVSVALSGALMQRPGTSVLDAFWILGAASVSAAICGWLLFGRRSAQAIA